MGQEFQNAFISYGRADSKSFAAQLYQRLNASGLKVWFDFEDIPLGVDYQNQIDDGIEKADNFLFIIAPHSINSPYCRKEIELALRRNKRIIPLLHVPEISRETWQQRNPNGTDAEWETYNAQGKHSSFPNMHPEISKINWVYCREGVDDFEQAFAGLLTIFDRHQNYVRQHTELLAIALEWERNQNQSPYLLIGEDLKQAEAWLKVRFKDEQPPCIPTDLHCQFITESLKQAKNLMTQIFLSHAEEDAVIREKVHKSLMRHGFTVWTNKTDIQTGVEFQDAINRGIEEADNLVYLISEASLQSKYCQQEIDYALSLNKRIIPLLVQAIDLTQIPESLRSLQHIDLTNHESEADYQTKQSELLRILNQDAVYYEQHKMLLTKALQWQRQQQNPTLLPRGYNLRQWEAWLKVGKQRNQQPPLAIQETFIHESLQQPSVGALDVFVAYTHTDFDFANKLSNALQLQGKTTWFDHESIPADADIQQEIFQGIEISDSFLFIISPSSLPSPNCIKQVEYARQLNKRIVTVLHRSVDLAELPPSLEAAPLLNFHRQAGQFSANLSDLIHTLDTDREHLQTHTRLLMRAIEWERKEQDESFLLRGSDLTGAEQWLARSSQKEPVPTELQQNYILTSRQIETAYQEAQIKRQQAEIKRQRLWLITVGAVSIVAILSAIAAIFLYRQAERSRQIAEEEGFKTHIKESEASFLAHAQLFAMTDGIKIAKRSKTLPGLTEETKNDARSSLRRMLYGITEQNRLEGHSAPVLAVHFSPDGKLIATGSVDNTARLWSRDGKLLQTLKGHNGKVLAVEFSPNGEMLATASSDTTVKLWKPDGTLLRTLKGHTKAVRSISFSPDGQTIATAGNDNIAILWDTQGKQLNTLKGHQNLVRDVQFSPDGQLIATASADKTVRLWNREGVLQTTLQGANGHTEAINAMAFSPNSQFIATASSDNTIKLWRRNGTFIRTVGSHSNDVYSVVFSADGTKIASGGADNAIYTWSLKGQLLRTIKGHNDSVYGLSFDPKNGEVLASASGDRTVRLWRLQNTWVKILGGLSDSIYSLNFSPDGKHLVAGGNNGAIGVWSVKGNQLYTDSESDQVQVHVDRVNWLGFNPQQELLSISDDGLLAIRDKNYRPSKKLQISTTEVRRSEISPDGQILALSTVTGVIELWDLNRNQRRSLRGHQAPARSIGFSPDGQLLASGDDSGQVILWKRDGTLVKQFSAHQGKIVRSLSFSPDGQLLATAGDDNNIYLWKYDGTLVATLKGHTDPIRDVVFSPDSQFLASGSDDKAVMFWKRDESKPIRILKGHNATVFKVRFSPDGRSLASGSGDNTIRLWQIDRIATPQSDLDNLITLGCDWLHDYLQNNSKLKSGDRTLCDK